MGSKGWHLFAHPLFHSQLERLTKTAESVALKDPQSYDSHPAVKLLATINHYIKDVIPRDPNSSKFRQGNTLGIDNRHWFRAKFHGRYRLFYRFSTEIKTIVYVWVNEEATLRKAGSKTDPYAVFKSKLERGELPNSFADLLRKSTKVE